MPKKAKYTNKNKSKNVNKIYIKIHINTTSKKRSQIKWTSKQGQPRVIYNNITNNFNSNLQLMRTLNTFKNNLDELKPVKIGNFSMQTLLQIHYHYF